VEKFLTGTSKIIQIDHSSLDNSELRFTECDRNQTSLHRLLTAVRSFDLLFLFARWQRWKFTIRTIQDLTVDWKGQYEPLEQVINMTSLCSYISRF